MNQLSPSALTVFIDCPRCFWLEKVKKIKRPRGIFPSLPGGIDRVLKVYYDRFRTKKALPPEIENQIKGKLFADQTKLDQWRNWRTGLKIYIPEADAMLIGAVDDLIINNEGEYVVFDFKSKGSEPKDDGSQYYQNQLNCYALMLQENGMPISGYGYLAYYYPLAKSKTDSFEFGVMVFKLQVFPEDAKKLVVNAAKCLAGDIPVPAPNCEYCSFADARNVFLTSKR